MDLNLLYSGGSGGFLLFHFLLLSDQYIALFPSKRSLSQIISHQWKIKNPTKWKHHETWPSNDETYNFKTDLRKIYFYCNPTLYPMREYSNFNLVIYTDYESQRTLARFKQAHWFQYQASHDQTKESLSMYWRLLQDWKDYYNNIKDPSWPECRSFRKINRLPQHIQEKLFSDPYLNNFLNYRDLFELKNYQGDSVYAPIVPFLESADAVIKLQDLVNTNGSALISQGVLNTVNEKQIELLTTWKNLHPPELLHTIGIL